jgi:hypothetical protein
MTASALINSSFLSLSGYGTAVLYGACDEQAARGVHQAPAGPVPVRTGRAGGEMFTGVIKTAAPFSVTVDLGTL